MYWARHSVCFLFISVVPDDVHVVSSDIMGGFLVPRIFLSSPYGICNISYLLILVWTYFSLHISYACRIVIYVVVLRKVGCSGLKCSCGFIMHKILRFKPFTEVVPWSCKASYSWLPKKKVKHILGLTSVFYFHLMSSSNRAISSN